MGALTPTTSAAVCLPNRPRSDAGNSLSVAIEARTIRLEAGCYAFPAGRGLTIAERRAMTTTMADLSGRLADLVPDDGGGLVAWVAGQAHTSFKARDVSGTKQQVYDGFLMALPGRSAPAVREAMRRILRNKAPPEYSRTFAPTPGEMAKLACAIEDEWRLEHGRLAWLGTIHEVRPADPEPQPTPEEMEAVRERARRLTAGLAARRAMPSAPPGRPAASEAHRRVAEDIARRKARRQEEGGDGEPSQ